MFELFKQLLREPLHKKLYSRVSDDHILDQGISSTIIKPGNSYFQVRLCELYLRDRREYWSEYIPMGIIVSEFLYNGKTECVPFFVGNQILRNMKEHLDGQYVDFRNTRVAGPIPYIGDDVGLFVGLFRLKVNDLLENIFSMLETIAKSFDSSVLSKYLEIAKPLGQGFSDIFSMRKNDLRFGTRDVFDEQQGGPQQLRQGYLVYANCPEDELTFDHLWVRENRLYQGKDINNISSFRNNDYCLVKLEHLETRNDYSKLPFYDTWKETRKLLFEGQMEKANWKRIEMLQSLANSPDLTEEHREQLIAAFEVKFHHMASKKSIQKHKDTTRSGISRSGIDTMKNPESSFQMAAQIADLKKYDNSVVQNIMNLKKNWEFIQKAGKNEDEPSDNTINSQLAILRELNIGQYPNPKAIADVLTQTILNNNLI
ncbi:MAG: hypothetical protein PVG39_09345 [Desulfobacteraceae bacterium]|jgi:hypothetical protein